MNKNQKTINIIKYFQIFIITLLFTGCLSTSIMVDTSTWSQQKVKEADQSSFNQWLAYGAKASKIDPSVIITMIDDRFKNLKKHGKSDFNFLAYTLEYYVQYAQLAPVTKQVVSNIEKYNYYWKQKTYKLDSKKKIKQTLSRLNRYAPALMATFQFEKAKNVISDISKEIEKNKYLLKEYELIEMEKSLNGLMAVYYFYVGEFDIATSYLKKEAFNYKKLIEKRKNYKWVYFRYYGYMRTISDIAHAYARTGKSASEILKLDQDDKFLKEIIDDEHSDKWTGRYNYYAKISLSLAIAGDYKNALNYIELAKESANDENNNVPYMIEYILLSYEAKIYFYKQDYNKSLELYNKASSIAKNNHMKVNFRSEGQIAMVLEKLGKYSDAMTHYIKAIKSYEYIRSSYIVNIRGKFFESEAKEVYWGYARTSALIYKKTKKEKDFIQTLYAMELLKARQLGDTKLSFINKEKNIKNISKYMKKNLKQQSFCRLSCNK